MSETVSAADWMRDPFEDIEAVIVERAGGQEQVWKLSEAIKEFKVWRTDDGGLHSVQFFDEREGRMFVIPAHRVLMFLKAKRAEA